MLTTADGSIIVDMISTNGGEGDVSASVDSDGGVGGNITITASGADQTITVNDSITAIGGNGTDSGGAGGNVTISTTGSGSANITISATVNASGGDDVGIGVFTGGDGGDVTITTANGDITTDEIISDGGDGIPAPGGNGGLITITAAGTGHSVTLNGNISSELGLGGTGVRGNVNITATDGLIEQTAGNITGNLITFLAEDGIFRTPGGVGNRVLVDSSFGIVATNDADNSAGTGNVRIEEISGNFDITGTIINNADSAVGGDLELAASNGDLNVNTAVTTDGG